MTQKVDKYIGIQLSVDTEIDEYEYEGLKEKLSKRLKDTNDVDTQNVEIYIHKLDMVIKPKHLGITPLEDRLAKLNVTLQLNQKAKDSGLIWFLSPKAIPVRLDPDVQVKFRKYQISYSLTGLYCRKHESYSDYIATIVMKGCSPKFKILTVKATAHATNQLNEKISNFEGYATTKLPFPLTRDNQINLD